MRRILTAVLVAGVLTVVPVPAQAQSSCETTPAIAHRGLWSAAVTENTVGSVNAALAANAPFEVDLRSTSDNKVVLMHDATVDRTTDGTGYVAEMTVAAIEKLHTNDGQRVPRVRQILDILRDNPQEHANLELKALSSKAMTVLTDAITARGIQAQVNIDSFSASLLRSFQRRLPQVREYLIYGGVPDPASLKFNAAVYTRSISQSWADAVHARGLVFRARRTDGPNRYESWSLGLTYGVTAFMTDRLQDYRDWCAAGAPYPYP